MLSGSGSKRNVLNELPCNNWKWFFKNSLRGQSPALFNWIRSSSRDDDNGWKLKIIHDQPPAPTHFSCDNFKAVSPLTCACQGLTLAMCPLARTHFLGGRASSGHNN